MLITTTTPIRANMEIFQGDAGGDTEDRDWSRGWVPLRPPDIWGLGSDTAHSIHCPLLWIRCCR